MRIQFFSDIHLEFGPLDFPCTDADVIVAAGDIGLGVDGLLWLEAAGKPVIYVAGNHEYYEGDVVYTRQRIARAARDTGVHFLENEAVVIDGVRFLGSTLWTDLGGRDPLLLQAAARNMNDYHQIHYAAAPLVPDDTVEMNERARAWLALVLAQPHDGKTVVVTHHAPSRQSWAGPADSLFQHAYCNDLEALCARHHIDLWVHGHVHAARDYRVNGTRIVCNPRGYDGFQQIAGFDPAKIIEI